MAALGNAMTALAAKLERIEERAMQAPLPAGPPPGPSGEMLLILELIKNMGQKESPTDTFLKMAALLKPPPAPDPLETLVRLKELSKSSDNSPLKERMEELMLLKKLSGNDNPFGDILKTFMTSPLGAGLGNGLGAAIRKSNEPVAPPPAALPAPSTAPPDFPAGYLEMFQKQINEAKDDAELVEAVVGTSSCWEAMRTGSLRGRLHIRHCRRRPRQGERDTQGAVQRLGEKGATITREARHGIERSTPRGHHRAEGLRSDEGAAACVARSAHGGEECAAARTRDAATRGITRAAARA